MTIHALFEEAKNSGLDRSYRIVPIPDIQDAYIGSDSQGRPCIFFRCFDGTRLPSLQTEQLSLTVSREFTLFMPGDIQQTDQYNTIFCLSDNPEDIEAFLTVIESFLKDRTDGRISTKEISTFFNALLRLFTIRPDENNEAQRQGLWGELYFMKQNGGYEFWAPYWHIETNRLFDFSSTSVPQRLEVKTTLRPNRIHNVSHRQVYSSTGEEIYIASMMLTEDNTGVSLRSLIDECREALSRTPHFMKLEKAVRHAGMHGQDEGPKYNGGEAARSIRFFDVESVPRFGASEPEGVSGTHYKIDLTSIPAIDSARLATWINSWGAE